MSTLTQHIKHDRNTGLILDDIIIATWQDTLDHLVKGTKVRKTVSVWVERNEHHRPLGAQLVDHRSHVPGHTVHYSTHTAFATFCSVSTPNRP
ncbi:hypothetical protein D3C77_616370 [compost metagenome]